RVSESTASCLTWSGSAPVKSAFASHSAHASKMCRMVVGRAAVLAAAGMAIGLASALVLTRLLRTMLYEVQPGDPETYLLVSALIGALVLVASYLPARRASRVNPSTALRAE